MAACTPARFTLTAVAPSLVINSNFKISPAFIQEKAGLGNSYASAKSSVLSSLVHSCRGMTRGGW